MMKCSDEEEVTDLLELMEPYGAEENRQSRPQTEQRRLQTVLQDLGLEQHYKEKLTLSKILQIDRKTITDEDIKCKSDLPWYFLKKLMMVNVTAMNLRPCASASEITEFEFGHLDDITDSSDMVNPLDVVTALFLCSDGFLQQQMSLKMSMCQFSVPLLLQNCDTEQCTLMLWAMRDIVTRYRPQSLVRSRGCVEERIVQSELPMISFVRLGECALSKSKILNELLSNSQQYHDTFVHHDTECGNTPRRISNGLTEITWYLPCGNETIDVFSEPVAVANLRGDIASFDTQFSFLCQTSAAVFVFFDNLDPECELLTNIHHNTQLFLVGNNQSKSFNMDVLKKVATKLGLTKNIILKTKQTNVKDIVKSLRKSVNGVIETTTMRMSIDKMADIAHELGILVDEDCEVCQTGKKNADAITSKIKNVLKYKADQLPLHGEIWKELTNLEKEEFHLKNIGSENIEKYKDELQEKKEKLRQKQNSKQQSDAMTCFISSISSPGIERQYFLKWMRMNLDNLSRETLSDLRKQYKEKCKDPENKEAIKVIDKKISDGSLGTEHFFREMGQIYEAFVSLSETNLSHKQLLRLPKICAELLLDGFPLELVDGDASNMPLTWVSDVLSQLNALVSPKNKILVVTVLGVQNTGKSTLLNTMFGVQFAVSSGRCTRGAFMLLIRINDDLKDILHCDFMVIIDTEGLKSPELAQLDDSYEHDNELATLVVGLSDITIINIAMGNATQMKDILQIVVHAFLRMRDVGKKPICQFVHQNVSDVSADENNLRDRKLLLEQLNEMTQAAAKMEKQENNTSFTDVMEYSADTGNWYIPGLWNGNPPMASVNAGYSEALYELKKNIAHLLGNCESVAKDILEFKGWMSSLWRAVKHEDFIFSFKNSLVAEAYMSLCKEYHNWEWEYKDSIYKWIVDAETTIANFGTPASKSAKADMQELIQSLRNEVSIKLTDMEIELLDKLTNYFRQREGRVGLVKQYEEVFKNSARSLRQAMESLVNGKLTAAVDIKSGKTDLQNIKDNHTKEIEKAVCELIDECRKKKVQMTDEELDRAFDKMWKETVNKLTFTKQKPTNVSNSVFHYLRENLQPSRAWELLRQSNQQECDKTPKSKGKQKHVQGFRKSQDPTISAGYLQDSGTKPFKYKPKKKVEQLQQMASCYIPIQDPTIRVQNIADSIIDECSQYVKEKIESKRGNNYSEAYIQEILHIIDDRLQKIQDVTPDIEFEVSLKQHICGDAARHFQKMQDDFLEENDLFICLNNHKTLFCDSFKDLFHKRDQSQKKAEEFTTRCLKPAVKEYVYKKLGLEIIQEMKRLPKFETRIKSRYEILLDLLENKYFRDYVRYIRSYEVYVREWVLDQIAVHFSNGSRIMELVNQHLEPSINSINNAINKAKKKTSGDLKTFINNFCQELGDKLTIDQDALGKFMTLNEANQEEFAQWFTECVNEMEEALKKEFAKTKIDDILKRLDVRPQDELFGQVLGCGKQCPFCAEPCTSGGGDHSEHSASLHRPQGLVGYWWDPTEELITDICTSSVMGKRYFCCAGTKDKWHPYKTYRVVYPDWKIPPDRSIHASDYWKYVMAKFNEMFAFEYDRKSADIPSSWKSISCDQAKKSLKESFNMS